MKIRPSVICLVAVCAVLIGLMLWHGKKQVVETLPTMAVETNVVPAATIAPNASINASVQSNVPMAQSTVGTDLLNSPPLNKQERETGILSDYNDQPILFYGKIEDQFSNCVPDAVVNFDVRVMNGHESTVKRGQITSDANGLFTISGYKGQDVAMAVSKVGYTFVSMDGSGVYSKLWPEEQRAHPDPNNPTLIKMWKLQGAEPLVSINQQYKSAYTNGPINFDLLAGNVVPAGGDLEIIVSRAPGLITQRRQDHGDWSIKLLPLNGGIMETDYHTSQVTFEAPADGYQDSYFVQMSHDDPAWFDNIQRLFYLTSRNGQVYSKFALDFKINDDPDGQMYFEFKGVANANGSRNWEATAPQ